jgi:hypothetical protein
MVTENSQLGAKQNNIVLGSGLSGMVAAYINARALEDNAAENESWQSWQAFRPRTRGGLARRGSHGGGTRRRPLTTLFFQRGRSDGC